MAPSVLWQWAHGFPFLELRAAAKGKNAYTAALPFLANQVTVMNPVFAPLWIAGLVAPFTLRHLRDLRFLVIAAVVVVAIVRMGLWQGLLPLAALSDAIHDRRGDPRAAGAHSHRQDRARQQRGGGHCPVFGRRATGAAGPRGLYQADRVRVAATGAQLQGNMLPQVTADQLGWRDYVDQVEAAWQRIALAERAATAIKVENYGEAAALDLYGRDRHQR